MSDDINYLTNSLTHLRELVIDSFNNLKYRLLPSQDMTGEADSASPWTSDNRSYANQNTTQTNTSYLKDKFTRENLETVGIWVVVIFSTALLGYFLYTQYSGGVDPDSSKGLIITVSDHSDVKSESFIKKLTNFEVVPLPLL